MTAEMTIDEFAYRASTSVRNVRAYLERGLLPPPRMVARTGLYGPPHLERMAVIQRLQREGFSLAGIRALLTAWESGSTLEQFLGAERALTAASSGAVDVSTLYPLTKFQRPAPRADHVMRRRCLQVVGAQANRHVLLTAPGGSGKSTLAGQMAANSPRATAWVSMGRDDDGPSGFWTAVLIALRTTMSNFGDDLLGEIVGGGDVDRVLAQMADQLERRHEGRSLVIDDLSTVADVTVMRQIGWFCETVAPTDCRLVVCSRSQPAFATDQLVADGRLLQLRFLDISFDLAEARELLQDRLGAAVDADQVDRITSGVDGWASGVYLAGMAVRLGRPADAVIATLTHPDRQVQERFAEEVLSTLPPEHVSFLEDIAILQRFTADLCDFVRQRSDSQVMLDQLADNMFVIPLDDIAYWRRLHHTFSAALTTRAIAAGTETVDRHHSRAATWHEQHANAPEAIHHYLQGQRYDEAARLIGVVYVYFLSISSRGAVVDQWLKALPDELVAGSATLCLAAAGVAALRSDRAVMESWLERITSLEKEPDHPSKGALAKIGFARGVFHFGDIEGSLRSLRSAYGSCPRDDPWFPMIGAALALTCSWVDGATDDVLRLAQERIAHPDAVPEPVVQVGALTLKAWVLAARGDSAAAATAVNEAATIRTNSHIDRVPHAANTWSTSARVRRLLGDVDGALADAQAGYDIVADVAAENDATGAVVPLLIELVFALRLQGRPAEAKRYAVEAHSRLSGIAGPGRLPAMLAEASHGL